MGRNQRSPLWVGDAEEFTPWQKNLSYALFRGDGEKPIILASRCPDAERFAMGRSITEALHLDEEALQFLQTPTRMGTHILWIHTDLGIGLLNLSYARYAGVGLYWHIHGNPDSLGRLLNHGVLMNGERYTVGRSVQALKSRVRACDMPLYSLLADAWQFILSLSPDENETKRECGGLREMDPICRADYVYGEEMTHRLEKLARFVGISCHRDFEEIPIGLVRCHRPLWREICLFFLLTEAATMSADGQIFYRLNSMEDSMRSNLALYNDSRDDRLSLKLHYAVENPDSMIETLEPIHRYLRGVGELHGMDFHAEIRLPKRGGRQRGELPQVCFYLDWLRDPTVLATSDLKAGNRWEHHQNQPFFQIMDKNPQ